MWFKAKIVKCSNPAYWYSAKIGETIIIRKTVGWGYEHKSGSQVDRQDVEPVGDISDVPTYNEHKPAKGQWW